MVLAVNRESRSAVSSMTRIAREVVGGFLVFQESRWSHLERFEGGAAEIVGDGSCA